MACHCQKAERTTHPSYGIIDAIDAQSVKNQYARRALYWWRQKSQRKRHSVVNILGNLLYVKVHAAILSDAKSTCEVLEGAVGK